MRKFVFIVIVFAIMVGAVTNVFGDGNIGNTYTYYEAVNTSSGDSYWNIAMRYSSDGMSKREYVEYIMKFNGATNEKLMAGQRVVIPVIKYL